MEEDELLLYYNKYNKYTTNNYYPNHYNTTTDTYSDWLSRDLMRWFNEKQQEGCSIECYKTDNLFIKNIKSLYDGDIFALPNNPNTIELYLVKGHIHVGKLIYELNISNQNSINYITLISEIEDINFYMTEINKEFYDKLEYALICLM